MIDKEEAKRLFPHFIELAYTNKIISTKEGEVKLCNSLEKTILDIKFYKSPKFIEIAKTIRTLYNEDCFVSIEIDRKLAINSRLDSDCKKITLSYYNNKMISAYPIEKIIQFYDFLYSELEWNTHNRTSPMEKQAIAGTISFTSDSKNYKRLKNREKKEDGDIDIRIYTKYKFKENIIPFYALDPEDKPILPIGFTLKGIQRIIDIEATLGRYADDKRLAKFLVNTGNLLKYEGVFELTGSRALRFNNKHYDFLYDISLLLELFNEKDVNKLSAGNYKKTFITKEMRKHKPLSY